jgi:hypothetical protein
VLVLIRDHGRRADGAGEVSIQSAAAWTVRNHKVVRVEFYSDRRSALKAVGLEE